MYSSMCTLGVDVLSLTIQRVICAISAGRTAEIRHNMNNNIKSVQVPSFVIILKYTPPSHTDEAHKVMENESDSGISAGPC